MRRSMALAFLVVLALAGCAGRDDDDGGGIATANNGATPTHSAGATPAADDNKDAAIKFSQCMRKQGLTWFPDPESNGRGGVKIDIPRGQDKSKIDAAMRVCKKLMPNGGEPARMDPHAIEQARQMARCMRANGVPKFPDPAADGQVRIDGSKLGLSPDDPAFKAADAACAHYRPSAPAGAPKGDHGLDKSDG